MVLQCSGTSAQGPFETGTAYIMHAHPHYFTQSIALTMSPQICI